MENTFVFALLFLFHFSPGVTYETYCSSGERLHTPRVGHDVCIPCLRGTFIAEENHFFRECKPCTRIENPDVEVLVSACNRTHDAVILCTGGFYRRRARNLLQEDRCEKCTECQFPARPCQGFNDTFCCPPNHDAVMTPDGVFVCKEGPIVCGAGQFFRTSSEKCLPCPAGTFMSDHSHTYTDCLTCKELSENNLTQAVITRPCNRTAPTLFGCKAGYFRDPTQESLQIEVPCTPCRICNRSLTDCGMFHDAVCDDEDRTVPTAATNITVFIGMSECVEMIKQLKATFNGSVHRCILRCTEGWFATLEDSIPQSESSKSLYLLSCLPEIRKARTMMLQMFSIFILLMLLYVNWTIWRKQKYLAADNCRKGYPYLRLYPFVLFVLNVIGILFIVFMLIKSEVIEDMGQAAHAMTVYCSFVALLFLFLCIVFILVNNVTDEIKLFIAPVNSTQKLELGHLHAECSSSDGGTSD